jgi:hypothetical protein
MKIPLILLLMIVAVFVVLMVRGSRKNAGESPSPDKTADAQNFNVDDYPVVGWLGSALGQFSPRLTVAHIQPSLATYDLQSKTSYSLVIAPDSANKFRSAKFLVPASTHQRCARLQYEAAAPPPQGLDSLKNQDSENLGAADKKNPKTEVSFTILSSGGQMIISRNSGFTAACVVTLEQ